MDLASVESVLAAVAQIVVIAAPIVQKAVENAEPFAKIIYGLVTGTNLTDDDVTAALAQANALSAQIQAPGFVPDAQDDDV